MYNIVHKQKFKMGRVRTFLKEKQAVVEVSVADFILESV